MTIKHTTTAIILGTLLSSTAFASDVTLSVAMLSSTLDSAFETTDVPLATTIYESGTANGIGGEIALGYLWKINSGFAMEFDYYYDFINLSNKITTITTGFMTHKISDVMGLRVLPMLNITQNTRIYLDIGWAYINQNLDTTQAGLGTLTNTNNKNSSNNYVSGYRYGGGISTMVYDNISIGLGYVIMSGASGATASNAANTLTVSATPIIQYFNTTLTWHFGF